MMQLSQFQSQGHIPVLIREVLTYLAPKSGEVYIDGTFGGGGYTKAILDTANCKVIAIDRDPDAIKRAKPLQEIYKDRLLIQEGCFQHMAAISSKGGHPKVDGVVLDLGVSSFQLDEPERGFSFRDEGPLDMRMEKKGLSAADIVNTYEEADLQNIIKELGDEKFARRIARAIVARRTESPFQTTKDLASVVASVVPKSKDKIDPATRTFQALRIYVNNELDELKQGLEAAEEILGPNGRLVVVSFHSGEDKIIKSFLKTRSGNMPNPSRHLPETTSTTLPTFMQISRKSIKPKDDEIAINRRSRSARLRYAIRTTAPSLSIKGCAI